MRKLTTLIFVLVFSQNIIAQFDIYGVVCIRKPLFIADTLTKGRPVTGIGIGGGLMPIDYPYRFSLELDFMMPTKDSVAVEVNCPNCNLYYGEYYDAALVTTKSFSVLSSYEFDIELDFYPSVYFTAGMSMGFVFYKFEYTYSDPIKTMISPARVNATSLYIGPQVSAYYEMDHIILFGSAFVDYGLGRLERAEPYEKLNSKWYFGLTLGISTYF